MIKFIYTSDEGAVQRTMPTEGYTWFEVTEKYQEFLEDIGYTFEDGFDMAAILMKKHQKLLKKKQDNEEYCGW